MLIKTVLIGDSKTGKTTFVNRHVTGDFTERYNPTYGANVNNIVFETSSGKFVFNTWDISGKYGGLTDGYYLNVDAAVIFFDKSNRQTFNNVSKWLAEIRAVSSHAKIVIVGSKCDLPQQAVSDKEISSLIANSDIEYYDISAKSNYNFEKPFLSLMRSATRNPDLTINQTTN